MTRSRWVRSTAQTAALLLAFGGPAAAGELAQDPAFGPDDLLVRPTDTLAPPTAMSPVEGRRDVQLLTYALKHAYGGRGFVPADTFSSALQALAAMAESPPETPDVLCDAIADVLWQIPDNHLWIGAGQRVCGRLRDQALRRPSVGPNVAARSAEDSPWAVTSLEVAELRVPVLSITRFPDPADPAWDGYSSAVDGLRDSAALIVDLRGNWGGNDERGHQLAGALLGREPDFFFDAIIRRQTPEAALVLLNPLRHARFMHQREGTQLPEHLRDAHEQASEVYEQALAGELPPEQRDDFPRNPIGGSDPYRNPVLVLADAGCASSCEDTVLYLKQLPGAVVIGQATGGYLHFGDVGWIVLPASQLRVAIPTKHFLIRDAYYERRGIAPDIELAEGTDALNAARAWLERWAKRGE